MCPASYMHRFWAPRSRTTRIDHGMCIRLSPGNSFWVQDRGVLVRSPTPRHIEQFSMLPIPKLRLRTAAFGLAIFLFLSPQIELPIFFATYFGLRLLVTYFGLRLFLLVQPVHSPPRKHSPFPVDTRPTHAATLCITIQIPKRAAVTYAHRGDSKKQWPSI